MDANSHLLRQLPSEQPPFTHIILWTPQPEHNYQPTPCGEPHNPNTTIHPRRAVNLKTQTQPSTNIILWTEQHKHNHQPTSVHPKIHVNCAPYQLGTISCFRVVYKVFHAVGICASYRKCYPIQWKYFNGFNKLVTEPRCQSLDSLELIQ